MPSTAAPAAGATYTVTISLAGLTSTGDTGYWISDAAGTSIVLRRRHRCQSDVVHADHDSSAHARHLQLHGLVRAGYEERRSSQSTAYSITVPAPTAALTSLTPTSGQAAATVVITGTNLGTSGVVSFSGTSAVTSAWSATAITCTVPAGLSAGVKNVTVTPSGAAVSNALPFTITVPAPVPPSPSGNDTTAPTTTASFNDGDDRHDEAVTVHLSAIDNSGGVGVASITYSIDGGAPVTVIGSSVTVGMNSNDGDHEVDGDHATDRNQYRERDHSGERRDGTAGPHTITYYATDAAGNAEVAQTLTLDDDSSEGSAWLHLQHR